MQANGIVYDTYNNSLYWYEFSTTSVGNGNIGTSLGGTTSGTTFSQYVVTSSGITQTLIPVQGQGFALQNAWQPLYGGKGGLVLAGLSSVNPINQSRYAIVDGNGLSSGDCIMNGAFQCTGENPGLNLENNILCFISDANTAYNYIVELPI